MQSAKIFLFGLAKKRIREGTHIGTFYAIFLAVPIVRVRPLILCNKAHCQMCAQ